MTDLIDTNNPDDEIDASEKSAPTDRREFGKLLAAGVGGLALGMSGCATGVTRPRGRLLGSSGNGLDADVIVIGAGLSGLIAARMLLQHGKSVILLEAADHVGGRMVLERTANGYPLDMGGQWVGPTQRDMQALVDELGIRHFTSYECGWGIQQWEGRKHGFDGSVAALLEGQCTEADVRNLPTEACSQLTPQFTRCTGREADMKLMGEAWKNLMDIAGRIKPGAPWAFDVGKDDREKLDNQTFAGWLKAQLSGAEDPARAYAEWLSAFQARTGGSGGFEPEKVSMLHMAWTQRVGPQTEMPEYWVLEGGAGQIPPRLVFQILELNAGLPRDRRIDTPVRLNQAVPSIYMSQDIFVRVDYRTLDPNVPVPCGSPKPKSEDTFYWCEDVILAIPPPMRAKIDFLPAGKWNLPYKGFSTSSQMGSMSKVHLVYKRAFWRDSCLNGSVVAGSLKGDTYCEFIADSSPPGGSPGILTAFIAGDRNKKIETWTTKEVKEQVLKEVCEYFKSMVPNSEDFRLFDQNDPWEEPEFHYRNWNTQPWTCGAFTSYLPVGGWSTFGEMGWRRPIVQKATLNRGRIFFAGTEASDRWPGYYDGAIRAGKRAAAGVLGIDPGIFDKDHPDPKFKPPWAEESSCP